MARKKRSPTHTHTHTSERKGGGGAGYLNDLCFSTAAILFQSALGINITINGV